MLALCIPLCAVLRSPMIPIVVIIGTALLSLYVWNSGEKRANGLEADALRAKIKELEERLSNVEVINRFEDRLAEKQVRQAAQRAELLEEAARAPVPERS
ncbi:MAG: hypothetical protein JWQ44_2688 [Chthoniobacter sp.]|nr:hypothetical protein [Chthoniobacter sp.]